MDEADDIKVTASGELRDGSGRTSGIAYTLTHRFYSDRIQKEFLIRSPQAQLIRIVEPIVRADGVSFERSSDERVLIKQPPGPTWACEVTHHTAACTLSTGNDAEKYWSPFPAVECQPIAAEFVTPANLQESSVTLAFGADAAIILPVADARRRRLAGLPSRSPLQGRLPAFARWTRAIARQPSIAFAMGEGWCRCRESNPDRWLRRPQHYPLCYICKKRGAGIKQSFPRFVKRADDRAGRWRRGRPG